MAGPGAIPLSTPPHVSSSLCQYPPNAYYYGHESPVYVYNFPPFDKAGLGAAACDLKVESNEATTMGGISASGFLRTVGQPSMPTPSTYSLTPAMLRPLNQAHTVQLPHGCKHMHLSTCT